MIRPIPPTTDEVTFGYSHPLKTMFKKGKLPQVKLGFYGETLTKDTVTLEHLEPISKGGKTEFDNLVLANADINNARGDKPLSDYINFQAMGEYLDQFRNLVIGKFNGNEYIKNIITKVGIILNKEQGNV